MDSPPAHLQSALWLRLDPAARQLGCSLDAVRRMVKNGKIASRRQQHGAAYVLEVALDEATGKAIAADAPPPPVQREPGPTVLLAELIREAVERAERNAAAAAMWQARAEALSDQLARALPSPAPIAAQRPTGRPTDAYRAETAVAPTRAPLGGVRALLARLGARPAVVG